jgi:hypothetical protein
MLDKLRNSVSVDDACACAQLSFLRRNVNVQNVALPPALPVVTVLFSTLIDGSRV